jgi:hypothetical protein
MEMTLPHTLSLESIKNYSSSTQKITLLCAVPPCHTNLAPIFQVFGQLAIWWFAREFLLAE